eukprot:9481350-Pyramimonas_sp.AAC.2
MGAIISCLGGKTMDEYNALESQKQGVEAAKRAVFSRYSRHSTGSQNALVQSSFRWTRMPVQRFPSCVD